MRKIFGIIDVPEKATHAQIHGVTETGAIGPRLKIEARPGEWADLFPVNEISQEWLLGYVESGAYRLAFWAVDAAGKKTRLGATSGAVRVDPLPARTVKKKPEGATAPTGSGGGLDSVSLFALLREMNESADKKAREFYAMQTERDRVFYATLLSAQQRPQIVQAAPLAVVEHDDDDDDDDERGTETTDSVIRILKALGEEVGPLLGKFAKGAAEKVIEGGPAEVAP